VLACELGPHGIRVVTLESGGVLEAVPEDSEGRDTIIERIVAATMLGAAATFDDVGNVAAFAASDQARTITGSTINIACGTTIDYCGPPSRPFSFRVSASAHPGRASAPARDETGA
jgi:3-oxoacyl-[acyl-carrier protein] reductase